MRITSIQLGVIIAICAGVVMVVAGLVMYQYPGLNCFTFSRRSQRHHNQTQDIELQAQHRPTSPSSVDSETDLYGELYIPPNRKPVHVGLDIINRMLLATGLPMHTVDQIAISAMEQGLAPRLSIHLPRRSSMTPSEQPNQAFSASQVTALDQFAADSHDTALIEAVIHIQRDSLSWSPNRSEVFAIGDGEEDALEDETQNVVIKPTQFGTGNGMAQLYAQPDSSQK